MGAFRMGLELGLGLIASCAYAEVVGYAIHRLLHSDRVRFLSRNHMFHHLVLYGPGKPLRTPEYLSATRGRFALATIGAEWLLPSAAAISLLIAIEKSLGLGGAWIAASVAIALVWSVGAFAILHLRMHVAETALARHGWTKRWFLRARRLHDIHHRTLSEDGLMRTNFGIATFALDRLFGTYRDAPGTPAENAVRAAFERYDFVLPPTSPGV